MKNKAKLTEDDMSYSTSTSTGSMPSTSSSTSGNNKGATINLKKKDLADPSVQKNIAGMKNAQVNILDEKAGDGEPVRLVYLSDVKDAKTNEISKPFTINGKLYQMCRAMTPDKKKVMGVYSHDESDENGNKIYTMEDFENNIAKGAAAPQEPSTQAPVPVTQDAGRPMEEETTALQPEGKPESSKANFAGYKHFIVNKKTGKSRKFKQVKELASAGMTEDEQYMGIKEFKKYIDEVLFGGRKANVVSEDDGTATQTNPTIIASAQKLMGLIQQKIPAEVIKNIQNNTVAQREVILAFAKLIGVPASETGKITLGIKALETNSTNTASVTQQDATTTSSIATVSESIKKVIKTIKIKELK